MNLKLVEHSSEAHRQGLKAMTSVNRSQIAKRRSRRMALNAQVGLSGEDRQRSSFTVTAKASNLNRHGAAVQVNRELMIGSIVVVRSARGTQASARVIARLAAFEGVSTYGIEFIDQDDTAQNFWGITFPSVENRPVAQTELSGMARRKRGISPHQS